MKNEHQIETRKYETILSPYPPYLGDSPIHVERDENLVGADDLVFIHNSHGVRPGYRHALPDLPAWDGRPPHVSGQVQDEQE